MAESAVEMDFRTGARAASAGTQRRMDLRCRTTPSALIPERSVVLVTVVKPEASPLADARALAEVSTVVAASTVVADMLAEGTDNLAVAV